MDYDEKLKLSQQIKSYEAEVSAWDDCKYTVGVFFLFLAPIGLLCAIIWILL